MSCMPTSSAERLAGRALACVIFGLILLMIGACMHVSAAEEMVIVLDPGHGGNDPGAVNGTTYERENALKIAEMIKERLEAHGGFRVYLTRETNDRALTLQQRAEFADSVNAAVCISLHFNSTTNTAASGTQVCVSVKEKYCLAQLATRIAANLSARLGIPNDGLLYRTKNSHYWNEAYNWDVPYDASVGVATDYYGLINWCSKYAIPAIIVEHCYISNPTEVELIRSEWGLRQMAIADAEAIIAAYGGHTHSYGAYETDYPTSCMYAGKQSRHCTVCGARGWVRSIADAPDPEAHLRYLVKADEPSCVSEGEYTYYCAYSHSLIVEGVSIDEHILTETVAATGHHDVLIDRLSPVHTTDGHETYTCTDCWRTRTIVLPATETHTHRLSETKAPTCGADGYERYICTECSDFYEVTLPKTGAHEWKTTVTVQGDCTTPRQEVDDCQGCEASIPHLLAAPGHRYDAQGICDRCGDKNPDFVPPIDLEETAPMQTEPPETKPADANNTESKVDPPESDFTASSDPEREQDRLGAFLSMLMQKGQIPFLRDLPPQILLSVLGVILAAAVMLLLLLSQKAVHREDRAQRRYRRVADLTPKRGKLHGGHENPSGDDNRVSESSGSASTSAEASAPISHPAEASEQAEYILAPIDRSPDSIDPEPSAAQDSDIADDAVSPV